MRTLKAAVLYWWMAIFRVSGKALMAAMTSVVATLNGAEWNLFTPSQKFIGCVTALGAMWLVVDAFLDTTMSSLRRNPSAEAMEVLPGDTTILRKTDVASVTTTVETKD